MCWIGAFTFPLFAGEEAAMDHNTTDLFCDGCGVEITWAPVCAGAHHFCCEDCQAGRSCACAERLELEDERRTASVPALAGD